MRTSIRVLLSLSVTAAVIAAAFATPPPAHDATATTGPYAATGTTGP